MALFVGFMFFFNSVNLNYCLKLGFTPEQMNIDGNAVYAIALLTPLFTYE